MGKEKLADVIGVRTKKLESKLDQWFLKAQEIPLNELSLGDICIAIRQKIGVLELMPYVIAHLKHDINSGAQYDGELLRALLSLGKIFWLDHKRLFEELSVVVSGSAQQLSGEDQKDFNEMRAIINEAPRP